MDLEGLDIIIEDGWVDLNEKDSREVWGTVKINGDMYDWKLATDVGLIGYLVEAIKEIKIKIS